MAGSGSTEVASVIMAGAFAKPMPGNFFIFYNEPLGAVSVLADKICEVSRLDVYEVATATNSVQCGRDLML